MMVAFFNGILTMSGSEIVLCGPTPAASWHFVITDLSTLSLYLDAWLRPCTLQTIQWSL